MFRRRAIIGAASSPVEQQIIYGIKLDRSGYNWVPVGTEWGTYTDDAVGFDGAYMDFTNDAFVDSGWYNRFPFNEIRPCIVNNGQVVGYLKKDDYSQYEDGTAAPINDRTAGNVMVEIPKIYYKISIDNTYNYIQISNQPFTGACCLAHTYKGQELDKIYVDAYMSCATDYETNGVYSVSGTVPCPTGFNFTYETVYSAIKESRGNRCEPFTYNVYTLLECLFTIMFKGTNGKQLLGCGLYKYSTAGVTTGLLNNKGFCYGTNTYESGNAEKGRVKFLGIEDYYGGKYIFCSGVYLDSNLDYRILDPYNPNQGYSSAGLLSLPVTSVSEDLKPLPNDEDKVPVKLTGINALGFARTNANTSPTDVAMNVSKGFCSVSHYKTTGNNPYIVNIISPQFGNYAGAYGIEQYHNGNTSRRASRVVYFPEKPSQNDFTIVNNTLVSYNGNSTNVSIPSGVTSIAPDAFAGNATIQSVTIPNTVTSIGDYAFYKCTNLTSFTVNANNTVYSSQDGILYNSGKTSIIQVPKAIAGSITLPNTLTSIEDYAFRDCNGLTNITIPDSVTSIGNYAFYNCSGLTSVTIMATMPPTLSSADAFASTNDCPIYVPSGSVTTYQGETNWSSLSSRIQAIPA